MSFVRPTTSGFSSAVTPGRIANRYTSQEDLKYKKKKKEIQNIVLKKFKDMSWKFEVDNLSDSNLEKIKDRVIRRGFTYEHKEAEHFYGGMGCEYGGVTKAQFILSLADNPRDIDDEGYFSDGWKEDFRASNIRKKIQLSLNEQYEELCTRIEATIVKYPGYHEYKLEPKSISPIVMDWIKEDLEKRGFTVKQESGSCPGDISGSYCDYYNYWKIINPKINNSRSTEIYL